MRKIRDSKGFTLIELMIVVVIIGILAALAIPRFSKASDRAKEKEADGLVKQVYTLQQAYKAQNGTYATTETQLNTVGFEVPGTLQNYTLNTAYGTSPYCLTPKPTGASWNQRCIDFSTGVIN